MKNMVLVFLSFFMISISSSLSIAQVDLNNGLVGWYSFDSIHDSVVVNQATAQNKAPNGIIRLDTINKTPLLSEGIKGNALSFSPGSTGHVSLGVYDPSAVSNKLSISCWIYWNGISGSYHGIAGLRDNWDPLSIGWSMVIHSTTGELQFETNTATNGKLSIVTLPPTSGAWVHVVLTFDSSYAFYYFNTNQAAYGEMAFGAGRSTATFNIGAASKGGGATFNGTIDEFRIYDRILTKDEIKFLYDNPAGNPTAISENVSTLPIKYAIENYPNPFNPTTTINYSLPKSSSVTLKIVNNLGQTIRTLVDNEAKSAGQYRVTWNGKNNYGQAMASNVYYAVMVAGEVVQSKKIVLLK